MSLIAARLSVPSTLFRSATASSAALALGLVVTAATPRPAQALTMMLNFTGAPATDIFSNSLVSESFASWGFTGLSLNDVRNATLAAVNNDFLNYPAFGAGTSSPPLPVGKQLNINFEWTTGLTAPTSGDTQYFYLNIGDAVPNVAYLGDACYGCVRSNGLFGTVANGSQVGSILTDSIAGLLALASTDNQRINLLAGTISHEIGHTLLLDHPGGALANPGASSFSLMATGASPTNMPNDQRVLDRAFAYSEFSTLITTVGLRDVSPVPEPATYGLMALGLVAVMVRVRATRCRATALV